MVLPCRRLNQGFRFRKLWSDEIKAGLKRKLDIDIFMHNGNLSREQYATQMLNIAKDLYAEKIDKEIILQLSSQF